MSESATNAAKNRSVQLFTYLREFIQSRTKVVRDLVNYEDVIAFHDIPKIHGAKCISWSPMSPEKDPAEDWIELRKPKRLPHPTEPKDLELWIDKESLLDSSNETPRLLNSVILNIGTEEAPETKILQLAENPKIQQSFNEYVSAKWKPWAANDKIEKSYEAIYKELFSIYQKFKRFGEGYELLVGFGLLKLKNGSREIKRHLFTTPAAIDFDQKSGKLTLSGSADGIKLSLEQDMLEVGDRPMPEDVSRIESLMKESEDKIWDGVAIHTLGKSYAHAIPTGEGQYHESENPSQFPANEKAQVFYSPYLILRKNTDRSLLRIYEQLIERIKSGSSVPAGIQNIVGIRGEELNASEISTEDRSSPLATDTEVYFPLDSNREQKTIAEKLRTNTAVLVQGPPGTGKSHTIANLICHLLSQGQRILVTSHTTRALAVLKKKIPKEIAPLCVELLGTDHTSMRSLEDSVNGILSKYNAWDNNDSADQIKKLKKALSEKRAEYASTLAALREIREKDTHEFKNIQNRYNGTLESIARKIKHEESEFSWFKDAPSGADEHDASDKLFRYSEMYQETRGIPVELSAAQVSENEFNELKGLESLFVEEENIKSLLATEKDSDEFSINLSRLDSSKIQQLKKLSWDIKEVSSAISSGVAWQERAFSDILNGKEALWKKRLDECKTLLGNIEQHMKRDEFPRKVRGHEGRPTHEVQSRVDQLITHFFYENKGFGFWIFKSKVIVESEFIFREIYVNDVPCQNYKTTLKPLKYYLKVESLLEDFSHVWDGLHIFDSERQSIKIEQAKESVKVLEILFAIIHNIRQIEGVIGQVFRGHDLSQIDRVIKGIFVISNKFILNEIGKKIDRISMAISQNTNQALVNELNKKIRSSIGDRNFGMFQDSMREYRALLDKKSKLEKCQEARTQILNSFPSLLSNYEATFSAPEWPNRFQKIDSAIAHTLTKRWLIEQHNPQRAKNLNYQQEYLRKEIQKITSQLSAELSWQQCLSNPKRFGEEQRESLVAWQRAVARIGKGTGRHANRHRKDARMHMESCQKAIPAWIMPIHKVAEVQNIDPESYDVVILDEASQSGPEAIFLQYIGKRIVVVGDDKQISPDNVGLDRDGLYSIHQKFLGEIPRSDIIGPDNSFFDIADVRYGGRIRLREHFRCMPEIIQFSNNLCYASEPLIPLKQFGSDRLTPVVSAIHLPSGHLSGTETKRINPVEIEAIVGKIESIVNDPRYEDKTIGVISLLGEMQSKVIEQQLIDRIGAEEIEARQIVCGDAYAFQGDERDIMLLSLVTAMEEGKRIGALTKEKDKRRFNVAASRAKEQMFLYHSVTLNDLNPECMRYRLLDYCMNPKIDQLDINGFDIKGIKILNSTTDKNSLKPPPPFDSWFEVSVFCKIHDKGYRVIPQYEVNGRRIDLVVEGLAGRLAVECDGDQWHGPDQYDHDMARQRDLERCGWNFFRIRGSDYELDPDGVIDDLYATLAKMNIHPNATNSVGSDNFDAGELKKTASVTKPLPVSNESKIRSDQSSASLTTSPSNAVASTQIAASSYLLDISDSWLESLTYENLADKLAGLGLDVRDKRTLGGGLWVMGGDEIKPLVAVLHKHRFNFIFASNGSKTTDHKPSWFMRPFGDNKPSYNNADIKLTLDNTEQILKEKHKYRFYLNGADVVIRSYNLTNLPAQWSVEIRRGPADIIIHPFELVVKYV